ncbi:hypothetical protein LPJ56_005055 [Coemansia sp. RSA 2599]|nr:hypothetical protein LPJ75_005401 [Coemansia sp. RSA 2598]KAJ1813789.1 hypothetical protein LPJ56_005055 [Coemansia sp. RSA 2599]
MRLTFVLALMPALALAMPAHTHAHALPAPSSAPRRAAASKQLYQGLHLPPGLRHSTNPGLPAHRRRQIPYGGIVSFGNTPFNIIAANNNQNPAEALARQPPAKDAKSDSARPLLGLLDLDLDLHL